MIKKERLFYLIKSLSRSEKRYFRIFCRQGGGNPAYLALFNAIDKQEVYDEGLIRKKFSGSKFLIQLHVAKNYLRLQILKSLRNFHVKVSKSGELKDTLRNVEILFNKELYKHSLEELKKADRIASIYELNTELVEIFEWKRKIEQTMAPHNYVVVKSILNGQKKAISKIENANSYMQLMVTISENLSLRNDQIKFFDKEGLLDNVKNAKTLEARVWHHTAKYFLHLMNNKVEDAEQTLYLLIGYMEEFPHRIIENPAIYVTTINNFISFLIFRKKYTEALDLVDRAKSVYNQLKIVSENRSLLKQILRTYNVELIPIFQNRRFSDFGKKTQ